MAATSLSDGIQVWLTSSCVRHSTFQAGHCDSCCVSDNALETRFKTCSLDMFEDSDMCNRIARYEELVRQCCRAEGQRAVEG
jgi:hypothetical protein